MVLIVTVDALALGAESKAFFALVTNVCVIAISTRLTVVIDTVNAHSVHESLVFRAHSAVNRDCTDYQNGDEAEDTYSRDSEELFRVLRPSFPLCQSFKSR